MNVLIKFLSILFKVLGQTSPVAAILEKSFFSSFSVMCKNIYHDQAFVKYIVCSSCNQIYQLDDCVYTVGSQKYSKKCTYVEYPQHPQLRRRQPCGYLLLKTVEISSKSSKKKLFPFKIYCYQSLEISLKRLLLRQEFISNSLLWKCNQAECHETIQDIFNGHISRDFQQYDGKPFLKQQYSFAFILNVDWFQPFIHTQTSIGIIYLTVLNLPRYLRYKRENVILVGIIPGPREPKSINSF